MEHDLKGLIYAIETRRGSLLFFLEHSDLITSFTYILVDNFYPCFFQGLVALAIGQLILILCLFNLVARFIQLYPFLLVQSLDFTEVLFLYNLIYDGGFINKN